MKSKLYVGFTKEVEAPAGGCLVIDDEVREDMPRAGIFDPKIHSYNRLKGIDHKKARELATVL